MQPVIKRILDIEWEMFDAVENAGGRANCQDDWQTFEKQRGSQLRAWNSAMLQSYVSDLEEALQKGRNLMTEKYAYMMKHTSPVEYEAIKDRLPVLSGEKNQLINEIAAVQVEWLEALSQRYPCVCGHGRLIHSSQEPIFGTSFETYLKGELATYSMETLQQYQAYVKELLSQGKNLNEDVLNYTCLAYGYTSIGDAEQKLRAGIFQ